MPKKSLRVCNICGGKFPLDDFYYRADRECYTTACKVCLRRRAVSNYRKNHDAKLAYAKTYYDTPRGKDVSRRAGLKYNKSAKGKAAFRRRNVKDAEKVLARRVLNHAVARGDIGRSQLCERCGSACTTEGHHHDYSKPLAVTWLCPTCHKTKEKEVCYA